MRATNHAMMRTVTTHVGSRKIFFCVTMGRAASRVVKALSLKSMRLSRRGFDSHIRLKIFVISFLCSLSRLMNYLSPRQARWWKKGGTWNKGH